MGGIKKLYAHNARAIRAKGGEKMKYIIAVYWTSGEIETIVCETIKSAEICIKALREQSNIYFVSLLEFEKRKTEIN